MRSRWSSVSNPASQASAGFNTSASVGAPLQRISVPSSRRNANFFTRGAAVSGAAAAGATAAVSAMMAFSARSGRPMAGASSSHTSDSSRIRCYANLLKGVKGRGWPRGDLRRGSFGLCWRPICGHAPSQSCRPGRGKLWAGHLVPVCAIAAASHHKSLHKLHFNNKKYIVHKRRHVRPVSKTPRCHHPERCTHHRSAPRPNPLARRDATTGSATPLPSRPSPAPCPPKPHFASRREPMPVVCLSKSA